MHDDVSVHFDLLIIGSGAGSMAAALKAVHAGLTVLIIEKADRFGGSTALSGGVLWIPNSSVMKRAGVHDSHEEAKAYLDACIGEERPTTSNAKREAFLRGGPERSEEHTSELQSLMRIS